MMIRSCEINAGMLTLCNNEDADAEADADVKIEETQCRNAEMLERRRLNAVLCERGCWRT